MAEKASRQWEQARAAGERRRQRAYPVLEVKDTPLVYVLLAFDFSKTRKRLLQEFDRWSQLPRNKSRFKRNKPKTESGTPKQAKDRLKDLAAWRLYRELGYDKALKFAAENRKRDNNGKPRQFHDPREGQSEKVELNKAPLYSDEFGFLKAKSRAVAYRAELLPWEFGKFAGKDERRRRKEALSVFNNVLKEAQKISRSSS